MSDFTVGDLKRQLQHLDDGTRLSFGGKLTFYRVKSCGEGEAYIEWNEPQAFLDGHFRTKNPHIQVAFVRLDTAEWQEGSDLAMIDVAIKR